MDIRIGTADTVRDSYISWEPYMLVHILSLLFDKDYTDTLIQPCM